MNNEFENVRCYINGISINQHYYKSMLVESGKINYKTKPHSVGIGSGDYDSLKKMDLMKGSKLSRILSFGFGFRKYELLYSLFSKLGEKAGKQFKENGKCFFYLKYNQGKIDKHHSVVNCCEKEFRYGFFKTCGCDYLDGELNMRQRGNFMIAYYISEKIKKNKKPMIYELVNCLFENEYILNEKTPT